MDRGNIVQDDGVLVDRLTGNIGESSKTVEVGAHSWSKAIGSRIGPLGPQASCETCVPFLPR
jgi:hypothetical protein